jgi:hypothetical protein
VLHIVVCLWGFASHNYPSGILTKLAGTNKTHWETKGSEMNIDDVRK